MDEPELIYQIVHHVAEVSSFPFELIFIVSKCFQNLDIPVTCKIRVFDDLEKTLEYARNLERSQCSLLAVHGRTRDQKDQKTIRADWEIIKRIKQELTIPVLANGNIRDFDDVQT